MGCHIVTVAATAFYTLELGPFSVALPLFNDPRGQGEFSTAADWSFGAYDLGFCRCQATLAEGGGGHAEQWELGGAIPRSGRGGSEDSGRKGGPMPSSNPVAGRPRL
jgi:hypothetical protein